MAKISREIILKRFSLHFKTSLKFGTDESVNYAAPGCQKSTADCKNIFCMVLNKQDLIFERGLKWKNSHGNRTAITLTIPVSANS